MSLTWVCESKEPTPATRGPNHPGALTGYLATIAARAWSLPPAPSRYAVRCRVAWPHSGEQAHDRIDVDPTGGLGQPLAQPGDILVRRGATRDADEQTFEIPGEQTVQPCRAGPGHGDPDETPLAHQRLGQSLIWRESDDLPLRESLREAEDGGRRFHRQHPTSGGVHRVLGSELDEAVSDP